MPRRFGAPLYIIAGFPATISRNITSSLKNDHELKHALYVQAASSRSGPLYDHASTQALLQETSAQVERRDGGGKEPIEPSRLILLYVPDGSNNVLFEAFGFSCFPIPIEVPRENQHLLRRNPNFAAEILKRIVRELPTDDILEIESQISRNMRRTLLLLPAGNFLEPNSGQPIGYWFDEIINGVARWGDVRERLVLSRLTRQEMPALRAERRHVFVDSRQLCFLPAQVSEQHGAIWTGSNNEGSDKVRHWLSGKYRFGIPIVGSGFHYDVQKRKGGSLANVQFQCDIQGPIQTTGTHVNIYPNDFVRK